MWFLIQHFLTIEAKAWIEQAMLSRETRLALRGTLVPSDPSSISLTDKENVRNAIAALHKISDDIVRYGRSKIYLHHITSRSAELWEGGILSWFTLLFEHYNPPRGSDFPCRWDVMSYVSCVFAFFMDKEFDLVSSIPGTAELSTRLWLVTEHDYDRSKYSVYCGWWAPFLTLFQKTSLERDPPYRKKIYDIEGVNNRVMMKLVLDRLQSSTMVENCSLQQYDHVLDTSDYFEPLDTLATRMIRTMTRTLHFLVTNMSPAQSRNIDYLDTCLLFFRFIKIFLQCARSIDTVREAIRSGLLNAFVGISPHLDWYRKTHEIPEAAQLSIQFPTQIIEYIYHYMAYASVLQAVCNCISKGLRDDEMPRTLVAEGWRKFREVLQLNLRVLNYPYPRLSICDNLKHDINSRPEMFLTCSGCDSAWYCSEACQRGDWEDVHRFSCQKLRESKRRLTHLSLRKRDHKFICKFAIGHLKIQWKEIQDTIQEQYPGKPLSELTIVFDRTRIALEIRVEVRDCTATAVAKHFPNAIVVQCHIPIAHRNMTTLTMIGELGDIEKEDGKPWITGNAAYTSYYEDNSESPGGRSPMPSRAVAMLM